MVIQTLVITVMAETETIISATVIIATVIIGITVLTTGKDLLTMTIIHMRKNKSNGNEILGS